MSYPATTTSAPSPAVAADPAFPASSANASSSLATNPAVNLICNIFPAPSVSSPVPPEIGAINVFRIPHSRMKELVESHLRDVIKIKDFSSAVLSEDIDLILQAVYQAMWELKSHEYIENHYIMDRLKARLQARRVYNQLVCNCHEDSKLLGVIQLVERVYSANSVDERKEFGRELQAAIQDFLQEFLHHMEEEEEVFQPLLTENFEAKELADMNEVVLRQHSLFREKVQTEKSLTAAVKRKREEDVFDEFEFSIQELRFRKSYCQEVEDELSKSGTSPPDAAAANDVAAGEAKPPSKKQRMSAAAKAACKRAAAKKRALLVRKVVVSNRCGFDSSIRDLPGELIAHIFGFLSPRDLLRAARVCRLWNKCAYRPVLWRGVFPALWAAGEWRFAHELRDSHRQLEAKGSQSNFASSSESLGEDYEATNKSKDSPLSPSQLESLVYDGIIASLLPRVGHKVSTMVLTDTRVASSEQIGEILQLCPNLVHLDLAYTGVGEDAFSRLPELGGMRRLETLNLEGCLQVTDGVLENLRACFVAESAGSCSKVRKINLSGCRKVSSYGVSMLEVHQRSLEELDISGCYMLDGETLTNLVQGCHRLKPERLSYCNDIEDGPYPNEANGCMNLECSLRFCCQQLKN